MEPDDFARRPKALREERSIGSRELSLLIDRSPAFVSLIESRQCYKQKLPPIEALQEIARVFGMSVDELLMADDALLGAPSNVVALAPKPKRRLTERDFFERFGIQPYEEPLSLEGVVASAGPGAGMPQGIDDTMPRRRWRGSHLWEGPVFGDCMVSDLYPGEIVIYNERPGPEIGGIMVALRDEDDLLIKRLVVEDGRQLLRPNKVEAVEVDDRARFLGRAVSAQ